MKRYDLQSSYILHTRPYQETSLLLEVFTREHGRFAVIAKGVRRQKNPARAILQPFVPLLLSCAGRGEILSLKSFDTEMPMHILQGRRLISAFYINELLMRVLHRFDPYETLFQTYHESLTALSNSSDEQIILRFFEKALLKDLGYELPLMQEAITGAPIQDHHYYFFNPEQGPILVEDDDKIDEESMSIVGGEPRGDAEGATRLAGLRGPRQGVHRQGVYSGKSLLALAANDLRDPQIQKDAKRLMRQALAAFLGDKPLESRRLL